ncbi:MAG TPA: hypothetical protein VFE78_21525 [Gemmataceae bacterium]|jgi:hypothetical protein|nr:hypothetical protein [Gemmataceae bacterium]
MRLPKNLGMLLLAVWFILFGLLMTPALGLTFRYGPDVLGVLAIVVGVLLFLQR